MRFSSFLQIWRFSGTVKCCSLHKILDKLVLEAPSCARGGCELRKFPEPQFPVISKSCVAANPHPSVVHVKQDEYRRSWLLLYCAILKSNMNCHTVVVCWMLRRLFWHA